MIPDAPKGMFQTLRKYADYSVGDCILKILKIWIWHMFKILGRFASLLMHRRLNLVLCRNRTIDKSLRVLSLARCFTRTITSSTQKSLGATQQNEWLTSDVGLAPRVTRFDKIKRIKNIRHLASKCLIFFVLWILSNLVVLGPGSISNASHSLYQVALCGDMYET